MIYRNNLRQLLLLLVAFLFGLGALAAQPGETRTFEKIEKDLKQRLANKNSEIAIDWNRVDLYEDRGSIYADLYRATQTYKGVINASYANQGLVDFTKAIKLTKTSGLISGKSANSSTAKLFADRAMLHQTIWEYQLYRISEATVKERIMHMFGSQDFSEAGSDYLNAIQLDPDADGNGYALFNLYLSRAMQASSSSALFEEVRRQKRENLLWRDFDTAAEYCSKYAKRKGSFWPVLEIYLKKGDAAFALGQYSVALAAYQADRSHLGYDEILFILKRAKTYIKLFKPESALKELEIFFARVLNSTCAEPFLVRAQANRLLGKTELALADEKKAKELPSQGLLTCKY